MYGSCVYQNQPKALLVCPKNPQRTTASAFEKLTFHNIHQQTMPGRCFIKQPTNIEAWLINQPPLAYTTPGDKAEYY